MALSLCSATEIQPGRTSALISVIRQEFRSAIAEDRPPHHCLLTRASASLRAKNPSSAPVAKSATSTFSGLTRGGGAEPQGVDYPVWFATNRKPAPGGGFGGERGAETVRGRVVVHVPNAHRFGETGSGFWTRFWSGDDRLRVKEIAQRAQAEFYDEIHEIIQEARDNGDEPEALVFLHGYNVSFADAAIRAAQIGYDLKIPGATAFFSWPSRGDPIAYAADEASIEASERAIADFLVEFRGKVRFHQIILAAPDVDRDLFLDLAHLYSAHA